jgi:hypothetical protein
MKFLRKMMEFLRPLKSILGSWEIHQGMTLVFRRDLELCPSIARSKKNRAQAKRLKISKMKSFKKVTRAKTTFLFSSLSKKKMNFQTMICNLIRCQIPRFHTTSSKNHLLKIIQTYNLKNSKNQLP